MTTTASPPVGLSGLANVKLNARHQRLLELALATCAGAGPWALRKQAEARELLALAQVSQRLNVQWLDLRDDFRALFCLRVPVPTLPDPQGELKIANYATIGLTYREEAMRLPQPGYSFVQILAPAHVWHPNVLFEPGQPMCLGPSVFAGTRVRELIVQTYAAISLQAIQLDPANSAGVMNPAAALWWQANTGRIPLTRAPFLPTPDDKPATPEPSSANAS